MSLIQGFKVDAGLLSWDNSFETGKKSSAWKQETPEASCPVFRFGAGNGESREIIHEKFHLITEAE